MTITRSTVIKSIPSNAKVYLDDEYLGETPYKLTDSKIIFTTNKLKLKKEGYDDFETTFRKDEEARVGTLIGGFCLVVPLLWGMGYKAERTYELNEQNIQ